MLFLHLGCGVGREDILYLVGAFMKAFIDESKESTQSRVEKGVLIARSWEIVACQSTSVFPF